MLTAEQLVERRTGIGGSELAAILGADAWRTALDIWSTKARGPNGEIAPLLAEPPPELDTPSATAPLVETAPTVAGQILEDGIVRLYEHRTGARTRRSGTHRHGVHRWALATPDRFVSTEDIHGADRRHGRIDRGLECKLVGHFMAGDWQPDEPPERVWIQCQWGMACTELPSWDIAALIDGTNFRIYRVARDDEFIADALTVAGAWWERHVVGNTPPDPLDGADRARFTRRLHPLDNGEALEVDEHHDAAGLLGALVEAQARIAELAAAEAECRAKLEALCGENRSIVFGPIGRFNFASMRGPVAWKKVAEHLAGGPVEDTIADQFRGEGFRRSQLYRFGKRKGKAA